MPAFLDLDAILSSDLREEIELRQAEIREVAESLTLAGMNAARIAERLERAERAAGFRHLASYALWLDPLTGWDVIDGAVTVALGHGDADVRYVEAGKALDLIRVTRHLHRVAPNPAR